MKVSVIGATGYTGFELVKLLSRHKGMEIVSLTSESYAGKKISDVYPTLSSVCDMILTENRPEEEAGKADAFFLCLPHKAAMDTAKFLYDKGKIVLDLSADFRMDDKFLYEKTYETRHTAPELLKEAVYGQPELFGDKLKNARLVAVPGCYPTSVILPLYPLLEAGLIDKSLLIADSKSGTTGAGRKPTETNSFCEVNENFKPYGIFSHRHKAEIDHILSRAAEAAEVIFTPHLLPLDRGILSTIYTRSDASAEDIAACWKEKYEGRFLIRIKETVPAIKNVARSSFVDMAVYKKGRDVIIVSALDNLLKGASGQALQCLNIIAGFNETEGLI